MSKLNPEAIPSLLMGTDENEEEEGVGLDYQRKQSNGPPVVNVI
jgi:hypothetical protein